jgi:SPP1 family phage portal protein
MQVTEDIIRLIESDNQKLVSEMLNDLIKEHEMGEGRIQHDLQKRYEQRSDGVPIFSKSFANYEKVHERIPNDFFGDIIDLKTGYMGNEIVIEIDERKISKKDHDAQAAFLERFGVMERSTDKNSELVKAAAIMGKSYRLIYLGPEGDAKVMNIKPWETILFTDPSIEQPTYAMRYFSYSEKTFDRANRVKTQKRYQVEWYDQSSITIYRQNEFEVFQEIDKRPHFFQGVPIIEFKNNEEALAEPYKALELIDAYDNILSDSTSEVEQLRMAYMWLKGAGLKLTEEFQDMVEQTGIFPLPEDGAMGFAGKDLNGAAPFLQGLMAEIRKNIYAFSKSLDLSDDKGGDMRVIGWQIAILRMEMSAQVTERKFKTGYLRQYELLSKFWQTYKAVNIDPYTLRFVFTRKFPKDVDQEIDTLIKSVGVLPREYAYSLVSFIDNAAELAERWEKENPGFNMDEAIANAEQEMGRPGPGGPQSA